MIIQNNIKSLTKNPKTFVEIISDEKTVLSCVDWQITGEGPQERGVQVHKGRKGGGLRNQVTHTIKSPSSRFQRGEILVSHFSTKKAGAFARGSPL